MDSQQKKQDSKTESKQVVKKQPNVDTRFKTEDVTSKKGLKFSDFNLSEDVQLVS